MSEITLRDYQARAVEKILWSMKLDGNDLLSLPTGSGKSIVIAETARRLDREILITQPSKEILEQNVEKLARYVSPLDIGIYSASMSSKHIRKFTFATIGSIYKKHELFDHVGLVLVDEAHLVNTRKSASMYNSFLKAIGSPKVVGFTATPWRIVTQTRPVADNMLRATSVLKLLTRMPPPFFWNRLLMNINVGDLIEQEYLCPLEYEQITLLKQEEMKLNNAMTDFDLDDYEIKLGIRERQILDRIKSAEQQFNQVLVFCTSVRQAEKFAACTPKSYVVTAKTPAVRRDSIIHHFKTGAIKTVFNVGVLTTGFDHPPLDCIVLIRPTRSPGLYYQMTGRGLRTSPGKTHCHVIDFSGTVEELGRIETIRLHKGTEQGDKWELLTETGQWHDRALYSYIIKRVGAAAATSKPTEMTTEQSSLFV